MSTASNELIIFSTGIIAGGYSTRFGQDKALYRLEGQSLLEKQIALAEAIHSEEILVSCRRDQNLPETLHSRFIYDQEQNRGPIEGLRCLLEAACGNLLLIIAIDLRALTPHFLKQMIERVPCSGDFGVIYTNGEYYEPLCAVYPKSILPLIYEQIARENFSLQKLIVRALASGLLKSHALESQEMCFLQNMNTKP